MFYRQRRVGQPQRPFGIWKFATMLKNSPNMGTGSLTVRGDPRVTPVGKYLRSTKVNELPQLLNVVTGEMSFVGPRPQMQVDYDVYPERVRDTIYSCRPASRASARSSSATRSACSPYPAVDPREFYATKIAPYKGDVEMWYLEHKSLLTDARLVFHTGWVILFPRSRAMYRTVPRPAGAAGLARLAAPPPPGRHESGESPPSQRQNRGNWQQFPRLAFECAEDGALSTHASTQAPHPLPRSTVGRAAVDARGTMPGLPEQGRHG